MADILVIDDDDIYRDYLTTLLARQGHRVQGLRGGAAAAQALETKRFDAVITDLYMPEVDGIEILLAMKRLAPRVPVIGITGGISADGFKWCSNAMTKLGAAAVLPKPVNAAQLFTALRQALGGPHELDQWAPESAVGC